MSLAPGLAASRTVCALVGFCLVASAARAEVPDEEAIGYDQVVQALKDELVQFNRDAQLAEDEFLYPDHSRVSVYVSNLVDGLLLQEVSIAIDEQPPVVYTYTEDDARALMVEDALQRVLRANVSRGAHRIRFSYRGTLADGEDGEPLAGGHDTQFDKTLDPAEIELRIDSASRRNQLVVQVREWRAQE